MELLPAETASLASPIPIRLRAEPFGLTAGRRR
jgi:hypothetical protein